MAADNNNEHEVWTRVIEVYKDRPHMWDKKNKHYFNRDMRQQTFGLMFEIFREHEKDIDISSFKKKIENMRTSFSRELKKVNASKQTGSGSNDVYKPSLWYYNLFTFMEETTEPSRSGIDTMDPEEDSQGLAIDESSGSQSLNQKRANKPEKKEEETAPRKQRLNLQKKQEKLFDTAQQLLSTTDDWEVIGKSYGLQLKDLSKQQQVVAKKLISDVIFYGQLGKLTEESSITLKNQFQSSYIQSHLPNSFQNHRYQFSPGSSTSSPVHTPSPQHQAYAPVPISTPSPQYQAYAPVPTPSPQHQAQVSFPTPCPQNQVYAPVPTSTPHPQRQAYAPVPTPSPQHQAQVSFSTPCPQNQVYAPVPTSTPPPQHQPYAPVPTPSPQHQAQVSFSTPCPQNQVYAPVPTSTPPPQHQPYAPVPTPSPQHQAQASFSTLSPQHQAYTPVPTSTPSTQIEAYAPVPTPPSQYHSSEFQYMDSNSIELDNIDLPNTTFSNNSTIVEGSVGELKEFLLFKRKQI